MRTPTPTRTEADVIPTPTMDTQADVNEDERVDFYDIIIIMRN